MTTIIDTSVFGKMKEAKKQNDTNNLKDRLKYAHKSVAEISKKL